MIRKKAIEIAVMQIKDNPIISANGLISRDLFEVYDKNSNFYMLGSMGLASSIGLGLALKNPKKIIYIFDGDGNILMNLGSLTTIGNLEPKNLVHIVFDNESHASTGDQPTNTKRIRLDKIAMNSNYNVSYVKTETEFISALKNSKHNKPYLILVKLTTDQKSSKRILLVPSEIKNRFINSLTS